MQILSCDMLHQVKFTAFVEIRAACGRSHFPHTE
jgi:hypothetical protein